MARVSWGLAVLLTEGLDVACPRPLPSWFAPGHAPLAVKAPRHQHQRPWVKLAPTWMLYLPHQSKQHSSVSVAQQHPSLALHLSPPQPCLGHVECFCSTAPQQHLVLGTLPCQRSMLKLHPKRTLARSILLPRAVLQVAQTTHLPPPPSPRALLPHAPHSTLGQRAAGAQLLLAPGAVLFLRTRHKAAGRQQSMSRRGDLATCRAPSCGTHCPRQTFPCLVLAHVSLVATARQFHPVYRDQPDQMPSPSTCTPSAKPTIDFFFLFFYFQIHTATRPFEQQRTWASV